MAEQAADRDVAARPLSYNEFMKKFRASVWQEGSLYIAQCLDVDVASQGETEAEALGGLGEALVLHFAEPVATALPKVETIEVDLGVA